MHNAIASPPAAVNEPVRSYAPGSPERVSLRSTLMTMREDEVEILPTGIRGDAAAAVAQPLLAPVALFEDGVVVAVARAVSHDVFLDVAERVVHVLPRWRPGVA